METLEEIEGVILDQVKQIKEEETPPDALAHAIAMELCKHFAGTQVYFRKHTQTLHRKRDQALRKDYLGGTSIGQLSRKYHLSQTRIYRILNEGE